MRELLFCISAAFFVAMVVFKLAAPTKPVYNYEETGIASYYANLFVGQTTANGEIFSQDSLTAAHKTLPFNTMVLVHNIVNDKKVMVRINDRGPFRKNRVIDLTRRAADSLGILDKGLERVVIYADTTRLAVRN